MFTQTLHLARMGNQSLEDVNYVSQLTQATVTNNSNLVAALQNQVTGSIQDTALILQQTQDKLNELETAFLTNGVIDINEVFSGNQVFELAQDVLGAFQQINVITNNLNTQLGGIVSQLTNIAKPASQIFSKLTGFKGL